jgi:hypothetical protein
MLKIGRTIQSSGAKSVASHPEDAISAAAVKSDATPTAKARASIPRGARQDARRFGMTG